MINVARVLASPRLCTTFSALRGTGKFAEGGWVEDAPVSVSLTGVAFPTDSKDIEQLPEADRVTESMTFYSPSQMYVTHNAGDLASGTSDKIQWKGESWKVAKVKNYSEYGYYKAIATRISGD